VTAVVEVCSATSGYVQFQPGNVPLDVSFRGPVVKRNLDVIIRDAERLMGEQRETLGIGACACGSGNIPVALDANDQRVAESWEYRL